MIYKILHRTTYKYKYPVSVGNHVACLKPRTLLHHQLARNELRIQPSPATRTERVDYFGNRLCYFTVQEPHKELVVEARSEVVVNRDGAASPAQSPAGLDGFQFGFESPRIRIRPEFAAYARLSFTPGRPMQEALLDLTTR